MAGMIYLRVGPGRKFPPLAEDHPLVDEEDPGKCPGCGRLFEPGEVITLVRIGPGSDSQAREKCRARQVYNAVAVAAHWACVTGEEAE